MRKLRICLISLLILTFSILNVVYAESVKNYKDGIISFTFKSKFPGGNSGYGYGVIVYKTADNVTKEFSFEAPAMVKFEDIDDDGYREIVMPCSMGYPFLKLARAQYPTWIDIYKFDIIQEDLILADGDFPQYYKNFYIPMVRKELQTYTKLPDNAIRGRKILINMAQDIVDGKYKPKNYGQSTVEKRFEYLFYNS